MTSILYAEWEQPDLFGAELRAGFRSLRQSIGSYALDTA